ncbi:hypothetical protein SNEBB_010500 [Seison nebaliae]|nr:hypothetical protein SNEBB_010500 [Seison nebaliae]
MSELILKWLNDEIKLSKNINEDNVAQSFANGSMFGEILKKMELLSDTTKFSTNNSEICLITNYAKLNPIFKMLDVPCNVNISRKLMNGETFVVYQTLYYIYVALRDKSRVKTVKTLIQCQSNKDMKETPEQRAISIPKEMMRTSQHFDRLLLQSEEGAFEQKILNDIKLEKKIEDDLAKKKLKRINKSSKEARYVAAMDKLHHIQPKTKNNLVKTHSKTREIEETFKELDEFEMKTGRSSLRNEKLQKAFVTKNLNLPALNEVNQNEANKKLFERISTQRREEEIIRRQREKRRRSVYLEHLKQYEHQKENDRLEDLIKVLTKQANYEKRIGVELLQMRHEKKVIIDNRIQSKKALECKKQEEFVSSLNHQRETEQYLKKELKERFSLEIARQSFLKEELKEKIWKKHSVICHKIIIDLIEFACKVSYYRELTHDLIPPKLWRDWTLLFVKGENIFVDETLGVDDPTELESKMSDNNRYEILDENSFLEYYNLIGEWARQPNNTQESDIYNRILCYIVNRLKGISEPTKSITAFSQDSKSIRDDCLFRGITIGKPFSGKTTICRALEEKIDNFFVLNISEIIQETVTEYNNFQKKLSENNISIDGLKIPEIDGTDSEYPIKFQNLELSKIKRHSLTTLQETVQNQTQSTHSTKTSRSKSAHTTSSQRTRTEKTTVRSRSTEEKFEPNKTQLIGFRIESYLRNGKTIPTTLINELLMMKIKSLPPKSGWIIDGYPRNFEQLKELEALISSFAIDEKKQDDFKKQQEESIIAPSLDELDKKININQVDNQETVVYNLTKEFGEIYRSTRMNHNLQIEKEGHFVPLESVFPEDMWHSTEYETKRSLFDVVFHLHASNDKIIERAVTHYVKNMKDTNTLFSSSDLRFDIEKAQERIISFEKESTELLLFWTKFSITFQMLTDQMESEELQTVMEKLIRNVMERRDTYLTELEEFKLLQSDSTFSLNNITQMLGDNESMRGFSKVEITEGKSSKGDRSNTEDIIKEDDTRGTRTKGGDTKEGTMKPDDMKSTYRGDRTVKAESRRSAMPVAPPPPPPVTIPGIKLPKPGDAQWHYLNLPIPENLGEVFYGQWNSIEMNYVDALKMLFRKLRADNELTIGFFHNVKQEFTLFLERVDAKQEYVQQFVAEYNQFDLDLFDDEEVRAEWFFRINDLRDRLWELIVKKKEEAEFEANSILDKTWMKDEQYLITNHYIAMFQIEMDRYMDTTRLLKDYYSSMEKKSLKKLHSIDFPKLPFINLDHNPTSNSVTPQPPPTVAGSQDGNSRTVKNVKSSQHDDSSIMESPGILFLPPHKLATLPQVLQIFKDRVTKEKKGSETKKTNSLMQQMNETKIKDMIKDHQFLSSYRTDIEEENIIANCYQLAHLLVLSNNTGHSYTTEMQDLETSRKILKQQITDFIGKETQKKDTNSNGTETKDKTSKHKTKAASVIEAKGSPAGNSINAEEEELRKAQIMKGLNERAHLYDEYEACLEREYYLLGRRLIEIAMKACNDLRVFRDQFKTIQTLLNDWNESHFLKEKESIDNMVLILQATVESCSHIQNELMLTESEFIIFEDVKLKTEKSGPEMSAIEVMPPMRHTLTLAQSLYLYSQYELQTEWDVTSTKWRNTHEELDALSSMVQKNKGDDLIVKVRNWFNNSFVPLKVFCDLLQNTVTLSHGTNSLPTAWLELDNVNISLLGAILSNENDFINWRLFLLECTKPWPKPTMKDLLIWYKKCNELDLDEKGYITENDFFKIPLWFDTDQYSSAYHHLKIKNSDNNSDIVSQLTESEEEILNTTFEDVSFVDLNANKRPNEPSQFHRFDHLQTVWFRMFGIEDFHSAHQGVAFSFSDVGKKGQSNLVWPYKQAILLFAADSEAKTGAIKALNLLSYEVTQKEVADEDVLVQENDVDNSAVYTVRLNDLYELFVEPYKLEHSKFLERQYPEIVSHDVEEDLGEGQEFIQTNILHHDVFLKKLSTIANEKYGHTDIELLEDLIKIFTDLTSSPEDIELSNNDIFQVPLIFSEIKNHSIFQKLIQRCNRFYTASFKNIFKPDSNEDLGGQTM